MKRLLMTSITYLVACSGVGDSGSPSLDASIDASSDASPADGGDLGPRGVYIPTFHRPLDQAPTLVSEVALPFVDGLFISRHWSDVEKTQGAYSWDSLDKDIQAVAGAGKKASLAIGAGIWSPPYVCESAATGGAGAQCVPLVVIDPPPAFGVSSACVTWSMPVPWDAAFQAAFGKMVAALGQHINANPALAAAVIDIKVTGLNDKDEETILPFGKAGTQSCTKGDACQFDDGGAAGQCMVTNALAAMEAFGYSDKSAIGAELAFAHMFRGAFPGLPIGAQISVGLPSPESDNLPLSMLKAFIAEPGLAPITVQDQGLAAVSGVDPGTLDASDAGVPVGYQMLYSVAGNPTTCIMSKGLKGPDGGPAPCDESVLRAAIDNGIDHGGAQWLEIYEQDIAAYPDTSAYAHGRLVKP